MIQEITNADRAGWALQALAGFVDTTKVDSADDAISDLIVDLLHLARGRGLNAITLADRAKRGMIAESIEDPDGDMDAIQARFSTLIPRDDD